MSETIADQAIIEPSGEPVRGAKASADSMRLYLLDENEGPIYDVSSEELQSHANGAVADVLSDERLRLDRDWEH